MRQKAAYSKYGRKDGDQVAISMVQLFGADIKKGDSFILNGKIIKITRKDKRVIVHDKKLRENLNTARKTSTEITASVNELDDAVREFAEAIKQHMASYYGDQITEISEVSTIPGEITLDEAGTFELLNKYGEIGIADNMFFFKVQYDSPRGLSHVFDIEIMYDLKTRTIINYNVPGRNDAASHRAQSNLKMFL